MNCQILKEAKRTNTPKIEGYVERIPVTYCHGIQESFQIKSQLKFFYFMYDSKEKKFENDY